MGELRGWGRGRGEQQDTFSLKKKNAIMKPTIPYANKDRIGKSHQLVGANPELIM